MEVVDIHVSSDHEFIARVEEESGQNVRLCYQYISLKRQPYADTTISR